MSDLDSDLEEIWQILTNSPVYEMDPKLSMNPNMMMEAGFSNSPNSRSVQTYEDLVAPAELFEEDHRFLASSSTMDVSSPRSTGTASSPVKLPSVVESFSPQICQPQTSASNYQPQFAYAQPNVSSNYGYAQIVYPGNDQEMQLVAPKKSTKRQPSNSSASSPTKRGRGAPTNEYYFEEQPFTAENYKEFFKILSAKRMGFTIFEFTPLKIETEEEKRKYVKQTGADVQRLCSNGSYYKRTAHELKDGAQFAGSEIKKHINGNMYMRNYKKDKSHTSNSKTVATDEKLQFLEPNLHEELLWMKAKNQQLEAKTQQLEAERQNYRRCIFRVRNLEYDTQNDHDQVLNTLKEFCLYNETEIHDTL